MTLLLATLQYHREPCFIFQQIYTSFAIQAWVAEVDRMIGLLILTGQQASWWRQYPTVHNAQMPHRIYSCRRLLIVSLAQTGPDCCLVTVQLYLHSAFFQHVKRWDTRNSILGYIDSPLLSAWRAIPISKARLEYTLSNLWNIVLSFALHASQCCFCSLVERCGQYASHL